MKGDRLYLKHILDAIEKVDSYTSVGRQTFITTSHWQDAVIRQLEIVGEATKRLSKQLCSRHPDIPWRRIAGLRDVLIHDYMGVDINAGMGNHPKRSTGSKKAHRDDPKGIRPHIRRPMVASVRMHKSFARGIRRTSFSTQA